MSEPLLRRRSLPDSLRYLARKLNQPLTEGERSGMALTLNELADGLDPQAATEETASAPVDDGLCHATLQGWPYKTVVRCSRKAGHYDEAQEPDFLSSDIPEPGGWHQSEPG